MGNHAAKWASTGCPSQMAPRRRAVWKLGSCLRSSQSLPNHQSGAGRLPTICSIPPR